MSSTIVMPLAELSGAKMRLEGLWAARIPRIEASPDAAVKCIALDVARPPTREAIALCTPALLDGGAAGFANRAAEIAFSTLIRPGRVEIDAIVAMRGSSGNE